MIFVCIILIKGQMVQKSLVIVTDALPSNYLTAGNVLLQLHKELEKNFDVYYVNLYNKNLNYLVSGSINPNSVYLIEKPKDFWHDVFNNRWISKASPFFGEIMSNIDSKIISRKILSIFKEIKPDVAVFVIESQTSVAVAHSLVTNLKLQTIGMYWDPIEWWLNARKLDRFSKNRTLKKYYKIVTMFDSLIVPSSNMKDFFAGLGAKKIIELYPYR